MKIKIAVLVTAFSVMLTGCGAINDEPVGVTAPAAEVMSEETRETAETSVQTQAPETEATSETAQESTETTAKKRKFTSMTEPPPEITDKGTVIYQRPNPEIEVTAEEFKEFEEEIGYSLSVPEGAKNVVYQIDTEQYYGTLAFYLDDVLWNAKVRRRDKSEYKPEPYVGDYETEIDCEFKSGQVTKVHGVEGDIRYYRITYPNNTEAYKLNAEWFLEDGGYELLMSCYSEEPIYTMPIETLG